MVGIDQQTYRLIHYTSSPEVLASIAEHGFLLIPNKRYLINALLGEELFNNREPQEFGMVSFTQLRLDEAARHREKFGAFGIVVSWEWALGHGAQRVMYVDESGPIAETLAWFFRLARQELGTTGGSDSEILTNKAFAFTAPSTMWARLLTLYEYMEPERNSGQVEWRIVNKLPQYHGAQTRAELINEILSAVKLWKNIGNVRIGPNDIHAFVCPRRAKDSLVSLLPEAFSEVPILAYREMSKASRLARWQETALNARRGRERVVTAIEPPPKGSIRLLLSHDGGIRLPEVRKIWGSRLYQDELISAIRCIVTYETLEGYLCELGMPILDALYLLNLLKAMQRESGLDPLNPSDDAGRPRRH